jgi:hypothetical protein
MRLGLALYGWNFQCLATLVCASSLVACSSKTPTGDDSGFRRADFWPLVVASCMEMQDAVLACGSSLDESQYGSWFARDCTSAPHFLVDLCSADVIRDTNCGQSVGMTTFDNLIGECFDRAKDEEFRP